MGARVRRLEGGRGHALLAGTGGCAVAARRAHVRAPFIFESPAELFGGAFHVRIIESEYAFRLARDLPPRAAAYEREEVEAAVETLHPAIELVDCRYRSGLANAGAFSLVADNALAAAFVHADPIPGWQAQDLTNHRVRLSIDGEVMGEGTGEDVGGHPVLPLIWLANDRSRRGDGLLAGQFITTSSVTGIHQAPAECRGRRRFRRLRRGPRHFHRVRRDEGREAADATSRPREDGCLRPYSAAIGPMSLKIRLGFTSGSKVSGSGLLY